MKTLGERVSWALEYWPTAPEDSRRGRRRLFQEEMRERLPKGAGTSYRVLLEYLEDRQTPSVEWLQEAAELTGVRPAWLTYGDGSPTDAEAELERAKLQREAFTQRHSDFIASLDPGASKEAEHRRRALERFSSTLDAAAFVGAEWYEGEGRRELLRAAAAFLQELDDANRAAAESAGAESVLASSNSDGWLASWYDAALSLFTRRVVGLGIRSDSHTDRHAGPPEASQYTPIIKATPDQEEAEDGGEAEA